MTRPYAEVIGDPIAHSKSPLIHNFWLQKLGIDAEYRACHVRPDELEKYFMHRREDAMWRGCNVTIPHKVAAIDFVENSESARLPPGAINTVARDGLEYLWGSNTDISGFLRSLSGLEIRFDKIHAVVVGTGGAARAVLTALAKVETSQITLIARDEHKARVLIDELGVTGDVLGLEEALPCADLIVNASALGMTGKPVFEPDLAQLPENAVIYDAVYSPLVTPLLAAAKSRALRTIDGLDMLVAQAAQAFDLLFGELAPDDDDVELRALLTA